MTFPLRGREEVDQNVMIVVLIGCVNGTVTEGGGTKISKFCGYHLSMASQCLTVNHLAKVKDLLDNHIGF